jgi:hypothetical protein
MGDPLFPLLAQLNLRFIVGWLGALDDDIDRTTAISPGSIIQQKK